MIKGRAYGAFVDTDIDLMARPNWQPGADVYDEVKHIVSEQFDVPVSDLTPDTHFVDDLDESLQIAATVMACEETFGLEIPNAEAEKLVTVGLLAEYIDRQFLPRTDVWPPAPLSRWKTDPDSNR